MHSTSGKIIKTEELSNNTYKYHIKNDRGHIDQFIFFANNSCNPVGLDCLREVNIKYYTKNNKYSNSESKIIKDVKYGKYITNTNKIADLLVNKVGLTKHFVGKIIDQHGAKTLGIVFNNTEKLRNIEYRKIDYAIDKINKYKKKYRYWKLYKKLSELGFDSKYHEKIVEFNDDIRYIKKNIYQLCLKSIVPFATCDQIAMKLGYQRENDARIDAFVIFVYKIFNITGILYAKQEELNQKCREYQIQISLTIPKLIKINVDNVDYYTNKKIYNREKKVEKICDELAGRDPVAKIHYRKSDYDHLVTQIDEFQEKAIKKAFRNSLSIVTGAPGTGKSYIITHVSNKMINGKIYVLAPTGAAVERLRTENLEEFGASIITLQSFVYKHKNYKIYENYKKKNDNNNNNNYEKKKNAINEDNVLIYDLYDHYDEFIFFIDEMSMVSLGLFYKFLKIIRNIIKKVRLVLLGDVDQLPSIKGGYVLHDLIASRKIKCTVLEENHRTNKNSKKPNDIPENAALILKGKKIKENSNNVELIKINKAKEIKDKLIEVIKKYNIQYQNSCVIIPARKHSDGVENINPILQDLYNRDPNYNNSDKDKWKFRAGDKIIHGKNNKTKDIYNGSILVVDKVNYDEKDEPVYMSCKYYRKETDIDKNNENYRTIEYSNNNKDGEITINDFIEEKLDLAYAMTVHKAQGKGYDIVIIIIHSTMRYPLLNINMLYTALTRAKQKCIIIADDAGLFECRRLMPDRITNLYK